MAVGYRHPEYGIETHNKKRKEMVKFISCFGADK